MPLAVALTILIEISFVTLTLKITNIRKVCGVIILGNVMSFITPYIVVYCIQRENMGYKTFERAFAGGAYYIIGLGYLFLTIIIELPIVYYGLRKEIKNKTFGCMVICIVNGITTGVVFIIERIACYGQW